MAAGHLTDAPNFLTGLDSVVTGLGSAGDPAGIPFEQEFSDSLTGTIQQGQGDFDAFAVHLTGNNPPAGGGTGGGTGGGGGPNPAKCGTHGQSSIGTFDYAKYDVLLTMPICSVADGPCTFSFPIEPAFAQNAPPAVFISFKLNTGDAAVWKLGGHTGKSGTGERQDYYDVTITPKTPGHYDATGTLVQGQPNRTSTFAMSVGVIA